MEKTWKGARGQGKRSCKENKMEFISVLRRGGGGENNTVLKNVCEVGEETRNQAHVLLISPRVQDVTPEFASKARVEAEGVWERREGGQGSEEW